MPGTVVDETVTKDEYQDYFLISQSVGQGCVSPTHYNLIWNTTSISVHRHQHLSHKLTHLYYNWQGTVKVPAPVMLAHKYAYLVGEKIKRPVDKMHHLLHYL